jgi:ribosomal protein S18 acetylase RimI-like enzyme
VGRAANPEQTNPVIRVATAEDGFGLSELLGILGYPCPPEEASQRVLDLREDGNQTLLVAESQGSLVGLIACDLSYYLPLGELTCRITAVSVSPSAQRRGIGKLLLREAESIARSSGAVRIELTSAEHRHDAHRFYRACGYADGALRFVKRLGDA